MIDTLMEHVLGTMFKYYIADGHLIAMDYDQKNQLEVFNLGSGKGYSVLEIIHTFNNELGKKYLFNFQAGERAMSK